MANYRKHSREQIELKMMCINDFVPKDHKARNIVSIIERLELTLFNDYYNNNNGGNTAYPIKELLSILIYASLEGIYQARKIEKYCHEHIIYRYLCCDDPPDHSTISRFWKRFKSAIEEILTQTVYIGESQGLIDYNHVSGDGVRLESMGSRSKIFNEKSAKRRLEQIEKSVSKLVDKIDKSYALEEKLKLEKKLEHNNNLKERIENGMKELSQLKKEIKADKEKGIKRENTNYFHITEKEAKLVKKRGAFVSGYNGQALADSKTNMIVSAELTSSVVDTFNGKPLLEKSQKLLGNDRLKNSKITFDNGFLGDELIEFGLNNDFDLYVSTPLKTKLNEQELDKRKSKTPTLTYDKEADVYICCQDKVLDYKRTSITKGRAYAVYERNCPDCPASSECIKNKSRKRKQKYRRIISEDIDKKINKNKNELFVIMQNKMKKEASQEIYKKRFGNIEPVFGHIQEHKGFKRFTVWRLSRANAQWLFVCFVHNLYKIMKYSDYGK